MKKVRSQNGYTGIDIAISIIVIFIFVSIIAVLIYRFKSSSKEIELKSKATYIAINEIEDIKSKGMEAIEEGQVEQVENASTDEEGFFKTIIIQDYTQIEGNEEKIQGLVKKVTVKISYMFQAKEQNVELSTVITKENE